MKNKEYLNIIFNKLYLLLKSYDLASKDLHLVNNTFKFILNSDNILRDLFVLSSVNKLDAFVNYILFILKKIEEEKITYANLAYNIDTDAKYLEKEIINYFSVEPKKITEKETRRIEPPKIVIKETEKVDEYVDETIADFYSHADDDTDNIITDENFASKRNNLELVEVERSDDDINAVFNLPETKSIEENPIDNELLETSGENVTGDSDFSEYDDNVISESEFKSEAEKFIEETISAEYDSGIVEEKEKVNTTDSSYWDIPDEEVIEEKTEEVYNEEGVEITEEKPVVEESFDTVFEEKETEAEEKKDTEEIVAEDKHEDEITEEKEEVKPEVTETSEVIIEEEIIQSEILFDAPELTEKKIVIEEKSEEIHTEEVKEEEAIIDEHKTEPVEEKKVVDDYFEVKTPEEKIKAHEEEKIEEANEEFIQYENYVLRTNVELKFDFEKMMEFAKRLNKNYDERNLIIKDVIDKTSFLENCSRELSLEVITNIYETFKLSFEKISDGKYDLSEDTLNIFIDSLSLIESLLKGDDYLAYDTLIKSLDKLRKSLLKEKKQKVQAEQKQNEEKSTENTLSNLYPDEHKLFIANNIRKKISDIDKIFNSLNDVDGSYVQMEALNILTANLNNFKELVGYANTIQLGSLAKVAEGGYILIKYLQNYRKDPTEEIWKETFKYIVYVMRLLILNKPVEDLELFITYLNEPIKIYLSKENK
ncbi:MAG: hypothetical protein K1X86_02975 [Ignavibacteria bacterium]|nr:hypothetical protein [Ignavibacteria bacterium]